MTGQETPPPQQSEPSTNPPSQFSQLAARFDKTRPIRLILADAEGNVREILTPPALPTERVEGPPIHPSGDEVGFADDPYVAEHYLFGKANPTPGLHPGLPLGSSDALKRDIRFYLPDDNSNHLHHLNAAALGRSDDFNNGLTAFLGLTEFCPMWNHVGDWTYLGKVAVPNESGKRHKQRFPDQPPKYMITYRYLFESEDGKPALNCQRAEAAGVETYIVGWQLVKEMDHSIKGAFLETCWHCKNHGRAPCDLIGWWIPLLQPGNYPRPEFRPTESKFLEIRKLPLRGERALVFGERLEEARSQQKREEEGQGDEDHLGEDRQLLSESDAGDVPGERQSSVDSSEEGTTFADGEEVEAFRERMANVRFDEKYHQIAVELDRLVASVAPIPESQLHEDVITRLEGRNPEAMAHIWSQYMTLKDEVEQAERYFHALETNAVRHSQSHLGHELHTITLPKGFSRETVQWLVDQAAESFEMRRHSASPSVEADVPQREGGSESEEVDDEEFPV
ncbi:hypothetical protein P7C73_g4771, partial [Tremellales sp. Uapishka_1]